MSKRIAFDLIEGKDYEVAYDFGDGYRMVWLYTVKAIMNVGAQIQNCCRYEDIAKYHRADSEMFSLWKGNKAHALVDVAKGMPAYTYTDDINNRFRDMIWEVGGKQNKSLKEEYRNRVQIWADAFGIIVSETAWEE